VYSVVTGDSRKSLEAMGRLAAFSLYSEQAKQTTVQYYRRTE
jgi:hypothetical protein